MLIKNALVMSLGDPPGDPRPKRMIDLLKSQNIVADVISHPCKKDLGANQHAVIPIKHSFVAKIKRRLVRYAIAAAKLMSTLKERCAAVDGDFALLWHNSCLQWHDLRATLWGCLMTTLNVQKSWNSNVMQKVGRFV